MYYAIDFDTRMPESKHEDSKVLQQYIEENDLGLAIAIVNDSDELVLQLELSEMVDLYKNLTGEELNLNGKPDPEDFAANRCWSALEYASVPVFTKTLGKKLLKEAAKRNKEAPNTTLEPSASKPTTKQSKGVRAKDLEGMNFTHGPKTPRPTASFKIFTDHLDEALGEATFDELVKAFKENYVPRNPDKPVDDTLGRAYVRDAFNAGYIEEAL